MDGGKGEGAGALRYIASISYGKDSLAQLEVIHQNGLPLTDIVTADIMATPGIPAYLPEVVDFRERMDREIETRYGIQVTHIRAEESFAEVFHREHTARSKYNGIYGWPKVIGGRWCMKYLKIVPIQNYFKGLDCVTWIGIAADEPARHAQLNDRKRSALVEFGITEAKAMEICEGLGWVSPTYLHSGRDGCWFCPCQGIDQLRRLYNEFPELWLMMKDWDMRSGNRFHTQRTLSDYERRFQMEKEGLVPTGRTFRWEMLAAEQAQLSLFDLKEWFNERT